MSQVAITDEDAYRLQATERRFANLLIYRSFSGAECVAGYVFAPGDKKEYAAAIGQHRQACAILATRAWAEQTADEYVPYVLSVCEHARWLQEEGEEVVGDDVKCNIIKALAAVVHLEDGFRRAVAFERSLDGWGFEGDIRLVEMLSAARIDLRAVVKSNKVDEQAASFITSKMSSHSQTVKRLVETWRNDQQSDLVERPKAPGA